MAPRLLADSLLLGPLHHRHSRGPRPELHLLSLIRHHPLVSIPLKVITRGNPNSHHHLKVIFQ